MLNARLKAAHAVRDAYLPLKYAAGAISGQALACAATMASQRAAAGLKIGTGAEAIARIARAAALFAEAEQLVASAHPELGALIEQSGLSRHYTYGYGDEETVNPATRADGKPALIDIARAA